MMKRFAILILCALLLVCSFASAEEETITVIDVSDSFTDIPEGLEGMYALMHSKEDPGAAVVSVSRMPKGYVLVSVALSYVGEDYTLEELADAIFASDPNFPDGISAYNETIFNAETVDIFTVKALRFQTDFFLDEEGNNESTNINATVYLMPMQKCLLEIWVLSPVELANGREIDQAALESDLAIAKEYIEGDETIPYYATGKLDILTGEVHYAESTAAKEASPLEMESYTDPNGYFTLNIPKNALILTPASTEEEMNAARQRYVSARGEGADRAFDSVESGVREDGSVIIFTPDMEGYVEICRADGWEGVSTDMLALNAFSVLENVKNNYGEAEMTAFCETETVSGLPHVRESYDLRCEELSLTLALVAHVSDTGVFHEIDVVASSQELLDSLYRMMVDSIVYHEPAAE